MPKEELSLVEKNNESATLSLFKSFLPYIILISLLISGKFLIGKIGISFYVGFKQVFNLFNPGFIFILAGLIVILIWKERGLIIRNSIAKAFKGAIYPFFIVFSMLAMVQIMINSGSGQNFSGLPSPIILITKIFDTVWLPFFVPFVGAFGAFMTGSVTVSNIMFGNLFNIAATHLAFNTNLILSLGVVGAAAGNMIALADILTAEAVTGLKNSEISVLKGVIIPCLTYLFILGLIGLIVIR